MDTSNIRLKNQEVQFRILIGIEEQRQLSKRVRVKSNPPSCFTGEVDMKNRVDVTNNIIAVCAELQSKTAIHMFKTETGIRNFILKDEMTA